MDDAMTDAVVQILMILAEDNARREYINLGGTEEQWDVLDKEGFRTGVMAGIMVTIEFTNQVDVVKFGRTHVPE